VNRHQRLIRAVSIALAYDRSGGIHAIQAGVLNAMEAWAKGDADVDSVAPAVDAVLAALVRLEVALDGNSQTHSRVPTTVMFGGEIRKVCGGECGYLYQERCPDISHVPASEETEQ
jgi:hypothetical protein